MLPFLTQQCRLKKSPKICTHCKVSEAKIYLSHSSKITKDWPQQAECPKQSVVQKQWSLPYVIQQFSWCSDTSQLKIYIVCDDLSIYIIIMCKLYVKVFVIKIEHEIFQLSFSTWTINILHTKHLWGTYKFCKSHSK